MRYFRALLMLLCCGLTVSLWGQTNARLTGTVTDSSGAVVSGATIKATNLGTQRVVTAQSDSVGNYVVPALPPGAYRVNVSQSGFTSVTQDITLETQQVATLNFQLKVGQVQETVEVTTNVPVLESATSNISDVIVGPQITELPLNGRNITQLATLAPGVTRGIEQGQATGAGNQSETFRYGNTGGASLSANGLRPQNNNFLLDGIDNNESLVNTIIFFPPAEAIQEFRVDTSVAPAEFGRAGGTIINSSFKTGSNDFHGSAFYFGRNDHLDATPYFSKTKGVFRRHQFGGTFGGPIIKNKLFFFGDYQGMRQYLPIEPGYRATVPTQLMRGGNFSELLTLADPIQIKDPITGLPLAGNLIPGGEIVTPGTNYLNAFPLPNLSGADAQCGLANTQGVCLQQNYIVNRSQVQNFDDFDIRVDFNATNNDAIFGRYSYGRDREVTSSRLPQLPSGFGSGTQANYPRSFALGETHTFNSTLVNEFRFGWIHTQMGYTPPFNSVPLSADLGIPNANTLPILGGGALIGGYNSQIEYTGDYGPYTVPEQTWQFSDSLSLVRGNHTLKFGASILRRQVNLFRPYAGKGYFFLYGNGGDQSPTGYEVSDLLAGFVNNYQVGPTLGFSHTRNWENGYYAQDDWKITRRLTLNLGLRYDYFTWPEEENNLQANFNLATGQLYLPGQGGAPKSLINTDTNNFAPRVGFAYGLTNDGKTVLRGGFGIFYFLDRGGIDNQLAQNPPFSGLSQYNYSDGYRFNLGGQAPRGSSNPALVNPNVMPSKGVMNIDLANPQNVNVIAYPPNNKNSYAEEWNLQVQRELTNNMSFSVGYVGSRGVDLMSLVNLNRQTYSMSSGTRLYPDIGNVNLNATIGSSIYHSLQTQVQRRFSNGLQFTASYTYSHTLDNANGALDAGTNPVDYFNLQRSNSLLDMPHRFVFSSLYELPFGRGKYFGNSWQGPLQVILGGWKLNPILVLQSGMPFDVTDNSQSPTTRPNLLGSLRQLSSINEWFDTSAFAHPASAGGVFVAPGTTPRNPFLGPGRRYLDLSIAKNFNIAERVNTEFRAEFYNLTNTPQFGQPNGDFNSGDFGKVKSTILGSEREIEFALRISF